MAILNNPVLGEPTGSIVDVVYRKRRGKLEMYAKQVPYEPPNSPAAQKTRNTFSFLRKTAAAVDKIYILKELWKNSDIQGYASYEKQMKVNSKNDIGPEDISNIDLVPPVEKFNAEMKNIQLDGNILKVTVHPLNLDYPQEILVTDISAHGLLLLTDPSGKEYPLNYIPLTSGGITYRKDAELNFSYMLINPQDTIFKLYRKRQFVICLIMRGKTGKPEYYSVNLSGRLDEISS